MKPVYLISVVVLLVVGVGNTNAQTDADVQYKAGADFAREIKGRGDSSLNTFNPGNVIPNYTDSPGEKNYYGGVKASGDGALKTDGANAWSQTEAGKAVTDSMLKNPKEPISPDAPFILSGKDVQSRADTIIGKAGQTQCEAQTVNRSEFTGYTCERDLLVEQYCTRTASVQGHYVDSEENKSVALELRSAWREGARVRVDFSLPEAAAVSSASVNAYYTAYPYYRGLGWTFSAFGGSVKTQSGEPPAGLGVTGYNVTAGENIVMYIDIDTGVRPVRAADTLAEKIRNGEVKLTLELNLRVNKKRWTPEVAWSENCPFSKGEGTLKSTECTEPGSTKTGVVDGVSYPVTQACWAYRDTYMTQAANKGTCKAYMDNPACTLASRSCTFSAEDGGGCLHEYATYSCETRTSGKVMICGGETFCLDGECERAQKGKNNDFAPVVSALAALAAAGKDVAALNGVDVRAFTGSAKFCKKFAAGFSNCCQDGGWGQGVGLASCSSEEKALGKAKENKLTVSVGEFCSKKVLGICLEKKRGYCQFDSKLAQIVQQQGRNGQLHVSFGSASSPDCRGITQTELQQIKFDNLDFSSFFEDLQNNQNIPDNNALAERVREQVATSLQNR